MKLRFVVREGDRDPLPAIDLADDVVVIGAGPGARVRLPVPALEHVRIEGDRWYALAEVTVDALTYQAGESGPIRDGIAIDLGAYQVRVTPAPDGALPATPQRTESLARELVRALLGAGAAPSLAIVKGPSPGSRRDLPPPEATVVIGRGDEADWVILDEDVSRAHARVVRSWDGVTVADAGSKNGTTLNGRRLDDGEVALLHDGDAIGLGEIALAFRDPAEQHLRAGEAARPAPEPDADEAPLSAWPVIIAAGVVGVAILAIAWVLASCAPPRVEAPPVHNAKPVVAKPPPRPFLKVALAQLASANWSKVYEASVVLGGHRAGALPGLVAMVARDERVELVNTADLIYPGAKKFYGHGWGINYDLDMLADRAGWVLEELAFRDFGFSEGVNAFMPVDPARGAIRRMKTRAAVATWWARAQHAWSCFDALAEALGGTGARLAYAWLRDHRAAPCDGFTFERFQRELAPIVRRHAGDPAHPMHDQAKLLLAELTELEQRTGLVSPSLAFARVGMMTPETTVQDLEDTIGAPRADVGSGIHLYEYALRDDQVLRVGSADGRTVLHIVVIAHDTERILWARDP